MTARDNVFAFQTIYNAQKRPNEKWKKMIIRIKSMSLFQLWALRSFCLGFLEEFMNHPTIERNFTPNKTDCLKNNLIKETMKVQRRWYDVFVIVVRFGYFYSGQVKSVPFSNRWKKSVLLKENISNDSCIQRDSIEIAFYDKFNEGVWLTLSVVLTEAWNRIICLMRARIADKMLTCVNMCAKKEIIIIIIRNQ